MEKLMVTRSGALLDSPAATQLHFSSLQTSASGCSPLPRQRNQLRCRSGALSSHPPLSRAHSAGSVVTSRTLKQSTTNFAKGRQSTRSGAYIVHISGSSSWSWRSKLVATQNARNPEILGKQLENLSRRGISASAHRQRAAQPVQCSATVGAISQFCDAEEEPRGFGAGIVKDIQRRLPHYASDFTDGLHLKAAAAVVYMTFASLAPCFAFGGMIARLTACHMGLLETIISCAVSGLIYTLLAGQPLTLLGPTGFMVVITGAIYRVTTQAMLPFLPVYGWVGIWSCLFLVGLAGVEASNELIKHLTRFVDETFTVFIAVGFLCEAYKGVANLYNPASRYPVETALLSTLLAAGTFTVAKSFTQLRTTRLLLRPVSGVLADFGAPLAIFLMSMVPLRFFPTVPLPAMPAATTIATTAGRPWLVPLFSIPPWAVAASAIPALFVTLLIFLDQNMTSRLVNKFKAPPLQKGEGYNLDLAVIGVITGLVSLFGLPWMVASAVPSLNHVRSLVVPTKSTQPSRNDDTKKGESGARVLENRLTGIMIYAAVGASLAFWSTLRLVPLPVTSGLFVFMSLSIVTGNQFVERAKLWLFHPGLAPEHEFTRKVPKLETHKFTTLQLACLWALWNVKESKWGFAFPAVILALVPVRNFVAARLFPPQHLAVLDPL